MEAFEFGSYGAYVWACFGLTFIVILASDWFARRRQKRVYREIEVRIKALEVRE